MQAVSRAADRLPLDNAGVADRLGRIAAALDQQTGNLHRVRAYRTAADAVRRLVMPAHELIAERGRGVLEAVPGVGRRLARVIEQLALTGRAPGLDAELAGPEAALASVAGIGPGLAHTVRERLGVDSLDALEQAAHDGRLGTVPGFGPKRVRGVREALAGRRAVAPAAPALHRLAA